MAYEPTTWVNGETPINESNLNKMEQGIKNAHDLVAEQADNIEKHGEELEALKTAIEELPGNNPSSNFSFDLLWENPSPASEFEAKTITVPSMAEYQFINIEYRTNKATATLMNQMVTNGNSIQLNYSTSTSYGRRSATYTNDTTITFGIGSTGGSDSATHGIPVRVYGIKCSVNDVRG